MECLIPTLTSLFLFVFHLSFSMFPSSNISVNYEKKTALEDADKVAYFWFSEQCLGILDVLYMLMIPIFLNI